MTLRCEDCANVDHTTRKMPWYNWRCTCAPKVVPIQFVVSDPWLTEPPFERCRDINPEGKCPHFEERKDDGHQ